MSSRHHLKQIVERDAGMSQCRYAVLKRSLVLLHQGQTGEVLLGASLTDDANRAERGKEWEELR